MASDAPLSTELHRVVVQLNGSRLKGSTQQRRARYFRYMKRLRQLARSYGATVVSRELVLKQATITRRKKMK